MENPSAPCPAPSGAAGVIQQCRAMGFLLEAGNQAWKIPHFLSACPAAGTTGFPRPTPDFRLRWGRSLAPGAMVAAGAPGGFSPGGGGTGPGSCETPLEVFAEVAPSAGLRPSSPSAPAPPGATAGGARSLPLVMRSPKSEAHTLATTFPGFKSLGKPSGMPAAVAALPFISETLLSKRRTGRDSGWVGGLAAPHGHWESPPRPQNGRDAIGDISIVPRACCLLPLCHPPAHGRDKEESSGAPNSADAGLFGAEEASSALQGGVAAPPPSKSPSKMGKWPRVSLGSVLGCAARGGSVAAPCSSLFSRSNAPRFESLPYTQP